jgi:hypothetical protein
MSLKENFQISKVFRGHLKYTKKQKNPFLGVVFFFLLEGWCVLSPNLVESKILSSFLNFFWNYYYYLFVVFGLFSKSWKANNKGN